MRICFIKNMPLTIDLKGIRENATKEPLLKCKRSTVACYIRPTRTNAFIQPKF